MITGTVVADEARIELTVRGPRGRQRRINAVVDTGYTGSLTLPHDLIEALRLPWHNVGDAVLADGSISVFDTFDAAVVWDNTVFPVYIDQSECDPLVGMELMQGYELKVQVREEGKVTLKRLSH